jgi:hypothetical protein
MKTSDVLAMLKNLIASLKAERATAFSSGLVERVFEIDAKIIETQTTIDQIESTL